MQQQRKSRGHPLGTSAELRECLNVSKAGGGPPDNELLKMATELVPYDRQPVDGIGAKPVADLGQ